MFNRRQFELIARLCSAGIKSPDVNFALARELIEIGEIAESEFGKDPAATIKTEAPLT